ncbi:DeoR/GlpR family DNA-binding transcription regulator [Olsenella massiliensis]|uniref:DeoR/GlpR family DNA-binding transcription regulator n=1 Tax=Olsenella massiliensis TaxID=1622075 RepID=UPI00071D0864|nr:DeoR/GlpR family DNA-binding transcription regulator [Olsenella massiliensis]
MRVHNRLVKERRDALVDLLAEGGRARVADLAAYFDVSALTIRRDLDTLADEGIVRRMHGSVELIDPLGGPMNSRAITAKLAIAREAARLVEDGDTVFVNTSSTALSVLEHITAQNVTVVTNNGRALQLTLPPNLSVILTGGDARLPKWSMTGEFALKSVRSVNAAKAIMGCSGLSAKGGITTLVSHETSINSLMIENADMHIVVADGTKIGMSASFRYGTPDQIDMLVTDESADPAELARLERAGVRMVMKPGERLLDD